MNLRQLHTHLLQEQAAKRGLDASVLAVPLAIEGFAELTADLTAVKEGYPGPKIAALGRAYETFGARYPALMELMFRGGELHGDDADLLSARQGAITPLIVAVAEAGVEDVMQTTLISWALVHGLVVLSRESAIAPLIGPNANDLTVASALVDRFVANLLAG